MKTILTILILLKFNTLMAGVPPLLVVSTTQPEFGTGYAMPPHAGQISRLWLPASRVGCINILDTHVTYQDDNVNVFVLFANSIVCPSPPPPPVYGSITNINGLDAGMYNLNYYQVPEGDLFPPLIANYPNYFRENTSFNVLQPLSIMVIDSSSKYSLFILILFLLFIGSFMIKNNQCASP